MAKGPLGGPRPFAETRCEPLLMIDIMLDDNRWKFSSSEGMNKLVDTISGSTGYIERNIYIRESGGPAEASDFYAIVRPGTAEYLHSVMSSVERMENKLESMDGVRNVGTVLGAGDPEEEINRS